MLIGEERVPYNMLTCIIYLQEVNFLQGYFLHIIPSQGVVCRAHLWWKDAPVYPASNPLGLIFITVSSSLQPQKNT